MKSAAAARQHGSPRTWRHPIVAPRCASAPYVGTSRRYGLEPCRIDGLAGLFVGPIGARIDALERSIDLGDLVSDVCGQPDVGIGLSGVRTRITALDPDRAVVAMLIQKFGQRALEPLALVIQTATGLTKVRPGCIFAHAIRLPNTRWRGRQTVVATIPDRVRVEPEQPGHGRANVCVLVQGHHVHAPGFRGLAPPIALKLSPFCPS